MIKTAILSSSIDELKKMLENELRSLVKIFPEIKFQTELLGFHEALKTQGIIPVVKFIKDNFNQLSQEEVLLHKDSQIIHLSVSQLVSKLILTKDINELLSLFNPESCRIALWEKVNSSILSKAKLYLRTKRLFSSQLLGCDQRTL